MIRGLAKSASKTRASKRNISAAVQSSKNTNAFSTAPSNLTKANIRDKINGLLSKKTTARGPLMGKKVEALSVNAKRHFTTTEEAVEHQKSSEFESQLKTAKIEKDPGYLAMDGNEAAAYIAYALSENTFLYPITPSSTMGEHMDEWATANKLNIFGNPVSIDMMQSEGGAAGAVHGSLAGGNLTTTFTSSQGLLLKIPNMYAIAGELTPTVIHVAARSLTKQAISMHGDHQDVMACRQTGWAMLCSSTVQECMDMALASHVATLKTRVPFLHFFDGMRTSHEIKKVKVITYDQLKKIFPIAEMDANLRKFELNPVKPLMRGVGHRPDIFFQANMASQRFYNEAPEKIEAVLNEVGELTGRYYKLFDYFGSQTAENVIVAMGSSVRTVEEAVNALNKQGYNFGVLNVRLFRPWSKEHFLQVLPKTVKRITVLDRCREEGAAGHPLFLDTLATLMDVPQNVKVLGGQYGISGKDLTPGMVKAICDNQLQAEPKNKFVIGIKDDVTFTSLDYEENLQTTPEGTIQCVFWGLGADGTVGANKNAISSIANNTKWKVQGFFSYDAYKTGGVTVSYLRFGPNEINSEYKIVNNADYVSCNKDTYVKKFDLTKNIRQGGIFVLNSRWNTIAALEKNLPIELRRAIAQKQVKFYNIDAAKIAMEVGLGRRINNIMQAAFYKLSGVLPIDDAEHLLFEDIEHSFKSKGAAIIGMNKRAVENTFDALKEINYPAEKWANLVDEIPVQDPSIPKIVREVARPILNWKGDSLPVSKFEPGGYVFQPHTTRYEKRSIALEVPKWDPSKCQQCNYCALVCPHSAIRSFLSTKQEVKDAPEGFQYVKAKGGNEMGSYNYSIVVSPFDCTGCQICKEACPHGALNMVPIETIEQKDEDYWNFAIGLKKKKNPMDKYTVKGSQFEEPLFEFSGACAGCGETAYVKLATQLFGDRMVIANATGCTRVWSSMFPHNPYGVDRETGKGVAYGHSLFEDNAEYGFGMVRAYQTRRKNLQRKVSDLLPYLREQKDKKNFVELAKELDLWLKGANDVEICNEQHTKVTELLKTIPEEEFNKNDLLLKLSKNVDTMIVRSFWFLGGDGWAYDIGYGGLDHVLSTDANCNILVVDTESYSNTGGQASKSTQLGASVKFSLGGKKNLKKDLGMHAMTYERVYVASIALGANYNQAITAFKEAEAYKGPSLILAYSPCSNWGLDDMKESLNAQKLAVDSGYWPLYRYHPERKDNKFIYESKKLKTDVGKFLDMQLRFRKLKEVHPAASKEFTAKLQANIVHKNAMFKRMSMDDYEMLEFLKKRLGEESAGEKSLILYGSETGNAQYLAEQLAAELKSRGVRAQCTAMDDYDFEEIQNEQNVYAIISTVGHGEYPGNSRNFMANLHDASHHQDFLKGVKFAVFGLGDSSYVHFNKASDVLFKRFEALGASPIIERGIGDDKDEDRFETGWQEFLPNLCEKAELPPAPEILGEPAYALHTYGDTEKQVEEKLYLPPGSKSIPLSKNQLLTPEGYDRDIRHYEFDIKEAGWFYTPGDVMAIYPKNDQNDVKEFLHKIQIPDSEMIEIEEHGNQKKPIPSPVRASSLFGSILDVFGKPSKSFLKFMSFSAKDDKEKKELKFMMSEEGKNLFMQMRDETETYADLLLRYPSCTRNLNYLMEYLPVIKPRLYSIASSQEMVKDNIELCIILNDWTTPSGKYKQGLTTRYLKDLVPNQDHVAAKLQAGACSFPESHKVPLVLVGLGTGISPIRSIVQERAKAKERGEETGPMSVYLGVRHKSSEYLYGDEFDEYAKQGVITNNRPAFSRDQEKKVYVHHKMEEDAEMLYDHLVKQNGMFYFCGSAKADDATIAIQKMLMKYGKMTEKQAQDYILQMKKDQRFNLDTW